MNDGETWQFTKWDEIWNKNEIRHYERNGRV